MKAMGRKHELVEFDEVSKKLPRLPSLLREIAEVTNLETALLIAEHHGGESKFFGYRPTENGWLTRLVGADKAQAICKRITPHSKLSTTFHIPLATALRREIHCMRLHNAGYSHRQIVRIIRVDRETVKRIIRRYTRKNDPNYVALAKLVEKETEHAD